MTAQQKNREEQNQVQLVRTGSHVRIQPYKICSVYKLYYSLYVCTVPGERAQFKKQTELQPPLWSHPFKVWCQICKGQSLSTAVQVPDAHE